jgi:hypothetical protein
MNKAGSFGRYWSGYAEDGWKRQRWGNNFIVPFILEDLLFWREPY